MVTSTGAIVDNRPMLPTVWHPVVAANELRAGDNIVGALVQGQEMALWRSLEGAPQAWENRCPHRGVRLTLGRVVSGRLSCAYHGWEYAAGSGRCAAIPALRDMPVPGKVCVKTYPVVEAQAMLWVNLDNSASVDFLLTPAATPTSAPMFCRTLALRADIGQVRHGLLQREFQADGESSWRGSLAQLPVIAFTLCAAPALSFIHLWFAAQPGKQVPRELFAAARRLRADIEASAG